MDSWQQYLNYFFPGEKMRSRPVFVSKGFEAVGQAISRQDYEAALPKVYGLLMILIKQKLPKHVITVLFFLIVKINRRKQKNICVNRLSFATLIEAKQMWI